VTRSPQDDFKLVFDAQNSKSDFRDFQQSYYWGQKNKAPYALVELPDSDWVKQEVSAYRNSVLEYFKLSVGGDSVKADKLMVVYDGAFLNCKLSPSKFTVDGAIEIAGLIVGDC